MSDDSEAEEIKGEEEVVLEEEDDKEDPLRKRIAAFSRSA